MSSPLTQVGILSPAFLKHEPLVYFPDTVGSLRGQLAHDFSRAVPILQAFDIASAEAAQGSPPLDVMRGLVGSLHSKHSATSVHSLRTTVGCLLWAEQLGLGRTERESIEMAALLHDIGKIVVPSEILLKPTTLSSDEVALVDLCRQVGYEVACQKLALPEVSQIVSQSRIWFDGSRRGNGHAGRELTLGARMLAIVDAYDAMTAGQVYRQPLSRSQALDELFRHGGSQFDPELVSHFARLDELDPERLDQHARRIWLPLTALTHADQVENLSAPPSPASHSPAVVISGSDQEHPPLLLSPDSSWVTPAPTPPAMIDQGPARDGELRENLFQQSFLDHTRDAVVFVDAGLRLVNWNRAAERLLGFEILEASRPHWAPSLVGMRDEFGELIRDDHCPVEFAMRCQARWSRRIAVRGADGRPVLVEAQVVPLIADDGSVHGATMLMCDVSGELSLQDHCLSLRQMLTRDPLTQLANRAELDRTHSEAVANHARQGIPYSLIICDIDHFKQINDRYGHPAGDEVLKEFSRLLEHSRRTGLAARYGGEEFVVLCPDYDLDLATKRANSIRQNLATMPQLALDGKCVTASFGVTSLQPGDTPESMLDRADKALYQAKASGRNIVVAFAADRRRDGITSTTHTGPTDGEILAEQELVTHVPLSLAAEKLRGFVADHRAEIVAAEGSWVRLRVDSSRALRQSRFDRRVITLLDVLLDKAQQGIARDRAWAATQIRLTISSRNMRNRRRREAVDFARLILRSFRSYMMVSEDTGELAVAPNS